MKKKLWIPKKPALITRRSFVAGASALATGGWTHGGINSSNGFLSQTVGYVPANFNMMPYINGQQWSDFSSVVWSPTLASVSTGLLSPANDSTAQKLTENSSGGVHTLIPNGGHETMQTQTTTSIPYRTAVIAKSAGRRIVVTIVPYDDPTNGQVSVGFDLVGGNTGYDTSHGSNASFISSSMTALPNGYWLCVFDSTYDAIVAGGANHVWAPSITLDNGSGTAARSTSYTGDGSSGAILWWFNILPKPMWDLTKLSFRDDFTTLNTIDLNNTGAPGFNWYVDAIAPNSYMPTFDWNTHATSPANTPDNLSISSPSILFMYNTKDNQNSYYANQLWSVYCPGDGSYVGTVFQPPMVRDGYFSWQTSTEDPPNLNGGAAFWGSSVEALTNTMGAMTWFIERDTVETHLTGSHSTHFTSNPSSPTFAGASTSPVFINTVLGTFYRMSDVWLSAASTGTEWGYIADFENGQFRISSDLAYSATSLGQPNSIAAGTASQCDAQHLPIFLGTASNPTMNPGPGYPFYVDWVQVYQKP